MSRVLILILAMFLAGDAGGCECFRSDPKPAFHQAEAVFLAEVMSSNGDITRLRVVERFKGVPDGAGVLEIEPRGSSCNYGGLLTPGTYHLIWADQQGRPSGRLSTSMCTRSHPVDITQPDHDLQLLRHRSWWWRSPLSRCSRIESRQ